METGLIYLKVILMMRRITVIFFFGFSDEDVNKQTNKQIKFFCQFRDFSIYRKLNNSYFSTNLVYPCDTCLCLRGGGWHRVDLALSRLGGNVIHLKTCTKVY